MADFKKPPIWFWIIGVIALLWNALGVAAYFSIVTMTPSEFAASTADAERIDAVATFLALSHAPLSGLVWLLGRDPSSCAQAYSDAAVFALIIGRRGPDSRIFHSRRLFGICSG